ncbi:hypothetical protein [Bdellovibrio bacteriovorus]|uniref:Lipoprotein n=1 Tax=Bdellovibrio bacteriovorus TaxID=959 RepID=A0A1Z3N4A5_BDEBC|nr:hypothetical protein [Bdellovibrio bacteriovorus]ASD62312.1 hypothetical protein B9G79_01405 [Bdellovibrio bacteriovorus]
MFLSRLILAAVFVLSACTHLTKTPVNESSLLTDKVVPLPPHKRTPAAEELDWWAANERQVKSAVCRLKLPVTTEEIQRYYKNLPVEDGYEAGTHEVAGVVLNNERPHLVLAFSRLLTLGRESASPEKVIKDFQKEFKIGPGCDKALCAAQKIFGADVGPQMLYLMDRFDVNTSPYSFTSASLFTAGEIADVIRTFELVKPDQLPFGFNKQLIKFKRGYTRASYGNDGGKVLANASIELFDSWSEQSSIMRQYTLYHEIAHNHSDNQFSDYDRSVTWLELSNWKESKAGGFEVEKKKALQGHPFVSRYGESNPFEDFAESVTAYRFSPNLLKKKSAEKYNLIKYLVHDGQEYTSSKNCGDTGVSKKFQKEIDRDDGLTNTDKERVLKACRQPFYQTLLGHMPVSFFDSCVNYEATQIWAKQNGSRYPDLVPQALFDPKLRVSTLKFTKLRSELATALQPELTDWILDSVQTFAYQLRSDMNNAEYCDVWAQLNRKVYPDIDRDNKWRYNGIFVSHDYSPKAGAARGICLDLAAGFVPTSKSTLSTVKSWIKETGHISTQGPLKERGISRETLLKYITDRTNVTVR